MDSTGYDGGIVGVWLTAVRKKKMKTLFIGGFDLELFERRLYFCILCML